MEASEFSRFKSVMTGMAKVYERELDGMLLDAYWLVLKSWSLSEFEQAAGHLMGTSEFMPKPAQFMAIRKAGRPTSGEAWANALQHAASSAYRDGQLGDSVTDAAVRAIGGYVAIAMCDEDKTHFLERRFAEHFETIQDAGDVREAVPYIVNRSTGQVRVGSSAGKEIEFKIPQEWS
jgi:hypothetical protein